jgi:hypothetical protein
MPDPPKGMSGERVQRRRGSGPEKESRKGPQKKKDPESQEL